MNIVEHMSLIYFGTSFGYMPRGGIAGSNFLRNCQTDFKSGCASLKSYQQWRSFPLFPHPHQHLLSPEFFYLNHSDWYEVESQDCFDFHFPDD